MFCTKNDFENDLIEMIRTNVIDMDEMEIKELYSAWINGYDSNDFVIDKGLYTKKKPKIFPSDSFLAGIDFPTWFGTAKQQEIDLKFPIKKNIMIVGTDPLRDAKIFEENGADKRNQVIIGTPYAFHLKKLREGKMEYWKFIEPLTKNHFVYLTDIYKVFFLHEEKGKNQTSSKYYSKRKNVSIDDDVQKKFLSDEIELIKPDIIITLGKPGYIELQTENLGSLSKINISKLIGKNGNHNKYSFLPMVHLSGNSRNGQNTFLKANNAESFGSKYGEAYATIVEKFISKQNEGNLSKKDSTILVEL